MARAPKPKVNWYADDVMLSVGKASDELVEQICLTVLGEAQQNIVANRQVDTGFMLNSGYYATKQRSTHRQAVSAAGARNADAKAVREALLKKANGLVAFAADYAIYQEIRKSFLHKALTSSKRRFDQIKITPMRR